MAIIFSELLPFLLANTRLQRTHKIFVEKSKVAFIYF